MANRTQLCFTVLTAAALIIFVPTVSHAVMPTLAISKFLSNFDNSGTALGETPAIASEPKVEPQVVISKADQGKEYVDRWFGPWRLETIVYAETQYSSLGPPTKGHVQITGHSKNSQTKWTIETYGRTLDVTTVNGIPPLMTNTTQFNEFPNTDSDVVEALKSQTHHIDSDASIDLTQYASDLLSAVSAMRVVVGKLYGKISGPSTCLPPKCFY